MKEYQTQNVRSFDNMYKQGWGNEWPSELMISYYHAIIKPYIISGRGGGKPKVLEFACGTGANLRFFDEINFEVYGIDSSESAIARCIQRGYKEKNFSAVNILNDGEISDLWPGTEFDLVICLSSLAYFDDNDIKCLSKKFYEVLKPRGVLYTNFYTTVREWPIRKMENGLYVAESNGSVDELTYLNLQENEDDIRKYYEGLYEEITIKRSLIEGSVGENETLHYFGYKK
ncbi:MAG: class I SAM-dependent methyltransferase [Lachnospiraceae bacterium]|nr:class I SAM-dependent methyltransferase [Lachnospiraceae bacterium]